MVSDVLFTNDETLYPDEVNDPSCPDVVNNLFETLYPLATHNGMGSGMGFGNLYTVA